MEIYIPIYYESQTLMECPSAVGITEFINIFESFFLNNPWPFIKLILCSNETNAHKFEDYLIW